MKNATFRQLRVFSEVARHLSFARAADHLGLPKVALGRILGLSQATVTRLYQGQYRLDPGSKPGELALLLLRLFRSLDSIVGSTEAARAWLARDNAGLNGVPRELIPLVPGSYTIEQASDYTLTYRLTGLNGQTTVLSREEVFHLRGPSWTGVAGLDALQVAREAVGLAIATEETHAALHANGTQPGGVLSVKGSLDDAARARLKESWAQYQGGLANRPATKAWLEKVTARPAYKAMLAVGV